jgi:hypothetical protein
MTKWILASVVSLVLVNCAHTEKAAEKAAAASSDEAKQVASQTGTSFVTEFKFPAKSTALTKEASAKLNSVIADAQADPKTEVDAVKLIVWADQEYPSKTKGELSDAQIKLAKERGDSVAKWLNDRKVGDVEVINMAKRPGAVATVFNTEDHRIKKALVDAGIPNTASGVDIPQKKGHAMVIVLIR